MDATGGRDLNFDGFTENRPVLIATSILGETIDDPATSTTTLDRNKFRPALFGEFLDVIGRNTFYGDGITTLDLGVYKSVRFAWGHLLTVRFEAYNALNDVQYGFPQTDINNANVGRLQSGATSYSPRTLQAPIQIPILESRHSSCGGSRRCA